MLMDAILKLHYKIMQEPLGPKRVRALERAEENGELRDPLVEMPSTIRVNKKARRAYEQAAAEGRTGQFEIEQRGGDVVLPDKVRPTGFERRPLPTSKGSKR
jgi:NADH-quinone oxidoreductase subunit B